MPKVTVIPPTINPLTHLPSVTAKKRRVAGYARVSTDSDEQFEFYEIRKTAAHQLAILNKSRWRLGLLGVFNEN